MTASKTFPGTFISFEGSDGAGKSTQIEIAAEAARAKGIEVLIVREPGGTSMSEIQRALVKADVDSLVDALVECGGHRESLNVALGTSDLPGVQLPTDSTPLTQLFIFNAARAQLFDTVVRPALERGALVLGDRSSDSSVAYQGHALGLGIEFVQTNCRQAMGNIVPERTIYCKLPDDVRRERMRGRGLTDDVIERTMNFDKVAEGFELLVAAEPERFAVVNAGQSIEQVAADVAAVIEPMIAAHAA